MLTPELLELLAKEDFKNKPHKRNSFNKQLKATLEKEYQESSIWSKQRI
jgi:hypothetical protein